MKPISKIDDWPDKSWEPDGYDMKTVPTLSLFNFMRLSEKVDELTDRINELTPTNETTNT